MEATNYSQKTARNRLHGVPFQNITVAHRRENLKSQMACTYLSKHSSGKAKNNTVNVMNIIVARVRSGLSPKIELF